MHIVESITCSLVIKSLTLERLPNELTNTKTRAMQMDVP